jgi:oligopeptidase B
VTLTTGGLSDQRVTYWESAKWVARLRDRGAGEAPILLKTNLEAGHGGASGRFDFSWPADDPPIPEAERSPA